MKKSKNKISELLTRDLTRIIASALLLILAIIFEGSTMPEGVSVGLYTIALAIAGCKVFFDAARGILRRDLLDEKFLMSVASVGAMIIGEHGEGVAVMLFFLLGEAFEKHAVKRSRASIRALMDIRPDEARVILDGEERMEDAEDVKIGSVISVRAGERVPIDSEIILGSASVDTSGMTGEAIPRSYKTGDIIESGVVVLDGTLILKTVRTAENSAASRILALVEEAGENKSVEERFITKFSRFYTPIVVVSALVLAVFLPIFNITSLENAIYRALMFLVISCPCALVISVPMAFFGGIGGAASRGILYKGGNVFAPLASLTAVAFDKTGTLTTGKFEIQKALPKGISEEELIELAAMAEAGSNHPIATALSNVSHSKKKPVTQTEYAGEGIVAVFSDMTLAVGNGTLMQRLGVELDDALEGAILVARDGVFVGELILSDSVKTEASNTVSSLYSLGVKTTVMLSGDKREKALAVAETVGISKALFELSPEQKYEQLRLLRSANEKVAYVGDGINDAPALALADVGIAMGGVGQDAAIESADVVIMSDSLDRIPEAIKISRMVLAIAKFNIAFALAVKLLILILGALNIANMWLAVFADVGVAVIAILNSMRTLISRRPKV
ncbi:MAG: cadmium-translocating P-type ATPase [Clostridia bacterium]|nr:cadmium-translocating P-type ATPase [Clostridia bacterium]